MPVTKKSGRSHSLKGKRTRVKHHRAKRSAHHKRKRTGSKRARKRSNKKKRSAHHKRRRHTRSMRGRRGSMRGGSAWNANASSLVPSPWIPSDPTNIYRSGVGGVMDASNAMSGLESDPSPLPYKGQLVSDGNMVGEILRMA